MKFGFVTCVQIGLSCMKAIYDIGGKLDLIISIPDDHARHKSGRIFVDDFAREHEIDVVKTRHINDPNAIAAVKQHKIDWLFIIGWSQIAAKETIQSPTIGTIGAHPTLLPVGRGRASIPWAIIKGLDKTGVTFFKMNEGVDTGLVLDQQEIAIRPTETATTLYTKVNDAHSILIKRLYRELQTNELKGIPQDESKATFWPGRKPADGEIKNDLTVEQVDRLVRATTHPYPGAFLIQFNKKVIIWAGRPSDSRIHNDDYFEIKLKDGFYYGTEYQFESLGLSESTND